MRARWPICVLAVIAICASARVFSQDAKVAEKPYIVFKFERPLPGVIVPRYTIELREDGTGLYHAEIPVAQSAEARILERPLSFTAPSVKAALEAIAEIQSSDTPCASKLKNIADTGLKTLTYRDEKGSGSCTYNYSENKAVERLTDFFLAVEFTLEEGRALDFKHRFDRLGLDAEIATLAASVENGRARELENIGVTLRSIAGDTEVIQRVRLRAAKLLEPVAVAE